MSVDNRILGDPGTPEFQVEKYPFFLLNRLVARYNGMIEPRLRAIGLDIPYWRVLMILAEHDERGVRELADAAVIPLSTMTRIVQRMANAKLIRLAASGDDGRVTIVSLRKAGRVKVAEARSATAPIYARLIRGLSAREFDKMIGLFNMLHVNLEDGD